MPRTEPIPIAVLGGSSAFLPSLATALVDEAAGMPALKVRLFGREISRTTAVAGFCGRHAAARGVDHRYEATHDLGEAVHGAAIVINQMRIGGFEGRSADQQLALEYGVPGDESIGPAGLAAAMRSLPEVLAIAATVESRAPDAWFLQVGNPMSMLLDGLRRHTRLRAFGLCELPERTLGAAVGLLGMRPPDVNFDYVGVNRQGWFVRLERDGEDMLPAIYDAVAALGAGGFFKVDADAMRRRGGVPLPGVRFFEHRAREIARQQRQESDRGTVLGGLAQELHDHYATTEESKLPPMLGRRPMPRNSLAIAPVVRALLGGAPTTAYVSEQNAGYLANLASESIVEKRCVVTESGPRSVALAINVRQIPRPVTSLLREVTEFERLGAAAAATGDPGLAICALMAHPFGMTRRQAGAYVDRIQVGVRSLP